MWYPGGMNRAELEQLSRDELITIILHLQAEVETLRQRIEHLEAPPPPPPTSQNSSQPETITNRGLAHSDAGKLSYEGAVNLWVLLIPMQSQLIAESLSGGSLRATTLPCAVQSATIAVSIAPGRERHAYG
jgi:hypothetical protein